MGILLEVSGHDGDVVEPWGQGTIRYGPALSTQQGAWGRGGGKNNGRVGGKNIEEKRGNCEHYICYREHHHKNHINIYVNLDFNGKAKKRT